MSLVLRPLGSVVSAFGAAAQIASASEAAHNSSYAHLKTEGDVGTIQ